MTSHTGTANVLYDLGFEDAADLTARSSWRSRSTT